MDHGEGGERNEDQLDWGGAMKIVWIDWDIIREKGKNAELTADVIDALVEMAKVGVRHTTRPDDCLQCGATSYFTELQHVEGCPILILKAACASWCPASHQ